MYKIKSNKYKLSQMKQPKDLQDFFNFDIFVWNKIIVIKISNGS